MARPAEAQPTNRAGPNSYLQAIGRLPSGEAPWGSQSLLTAEAVGVQGAGGEGGFVPHKPPLSLWINWDECSPFLPPPPQHINTTQGDPGPAWACAVLPRAPLLLQPVERVLERPPGPLGDEWSSPGCLSLSLGLAHSIAAGVPQHLLEKARPLHQALRALHTWALLAPWNPPQLPGRPLLE